MGMFRKIYQRAKKYKRLIILSTVCVFLYTGLGLAAPMFIREIVSMISGGIIKDDTGKVIAIGGILLGAYILRAVMRFMYGYYGHKAAWRFVGDIRLSVYNRLQGLSASYYSDKQTGQLLSRIITDTANFEVLIAHAVPDLITNVLTLIGVAALLFILNPTLALFTCIPLPFVIIGVVIFSKKLRPNFRKAQKLNGELSGELADNLSGVKEIQIFNRYADRSKKVENKSDKHVSAILRALFFSSLFHPAIEFFTSLGTVIVIVAGGIMAIYGKIAAPDIVAFSLFLSMFYTPITTLSRIVEDVQNAMASGERVFEVLDEKNEIADKAGAKALENISGNISFTGVNFSYMPEQKILEDINFEIEAGKMLSIVGPTGVGKTTIINLLMRFYDADSGSVMIDGIDIKDITLESLRQNMSIVLQDTFLFNGTIEENIAFAKNTASFEEVQEAAVKARVHEDILNMPDGYKTIVGERGLRLSGGQKQRISIARAILRNSPVLILDEATSAVDIETEQKIQEAIKEVSMGRTIITIAHRLSTIRRADKIIVVNDKKIVETGIHSELMKSGGLYSKLSFMQTSE